MKKDIIYFILSVLAVYLISKGIDNLILMQKKDVTLKKIDVELFVPKDQNNIDSTGRNIFMFGKKPVHKKIKKNIKKKKVTKVPPVIVPITKPIRAGNFRGLSLSAIYIKEKIKRAVFILNQKVYTVDENRQFEHFIILNIATLEVELMDVNNRVKKKMKLE